MKFILGVIVTLASTAAFATPAVGDYVKYDISVQQPGASAAITGTLEQTLTQYNASTEQFLQVNTTTVTGSAASQTQAWENATDLVTDAGIAQILSNCAAYSGQLVAVTTPVGVINTCEVPVNTDSEQSTYWISSVPFGIVQADILSKTNGNHTLASLETFSAGTK